MEIESAPPESVDFGKTNNQNTAFDDLLGDKPGSPAKEPAVAPEEKSEPSPLIEGANASASVTKDLPMSEAPVSQYGSSAQKPAMAPEEKSEPSPLIEGTDASVAVTEDLPVSEAPVSQQAKLDTSHDSAKPAQSGEEDSSKASVAIPSDLDASMAANSTNPALTKNDQSTIPAAAESSVPAPQKVERVDSLKQAKTAETSPAPPVDKEDASQKLERVASLKQAKPEETTPAQPVDEEDVSVQPPRPEASEEIPAPTHPSGETKQNEGVPDLPVSDEARRIAQLLTISPDFVNININVGFNTKFAVEEILRLRKEIAELKEENRRLRSRVGENEGTSRETQVARMSTRELHATLLSTEARVKELELENGRTRIQMAMMPERLHNAGHAGRAWE